MAFCQIVAFFFADKISGFALLNNNYKEKMIPEAKQQEFKEEKQKLADTTLPLATTSTRKELTIVGWSPNLLLNSTGEVRFFLYLQQNFILLHVQIIGWVQYYPKCLYFVV